MRKKTEEEIMKPERRLKENMKEMTWMKEMIKKKISKTYLKIIIIISPIIRSCDLGSWPFPFIYLDLNPGRYSFICIVLCLGHVNPVKPLSLQDKPQPISSNMKTSVGRGHEAVDFISGTLWLGRWIPYRTLLPRDAVLALHRLHTWLWTAICTVVLDSHSPIQEGSFTLWQVVFLFLKFINLTCTFITGKVFWRNQFRHQ